MKRTCILVVLSCTSQRGKKCSISLILFVVLTWKHVIQSRHCRLNSRLWWLFYLTFVPMANADSWFLVSSYETNKYPRRVLVMSTTLLVPDMSYPYLCLTLVLHPKRSVHLSQVSSLASRNTKTRGPHAPSLINFHALYIQLIRIKSWGKLFWILPKKKKEVEASLIK